jgi:glycosyltransferase involved in cell wall biosynthesis
VRIAIWLEQDASGGVSTHLISLLESWPESNDEIVLFTNSKNPGLLEVSRMAEGLQFLRIVAIRRLSTNSLCRKVLEVLLLPLYLWWSGRKAKQTLISQGSFDVFLANEGGYPGSWPTLGALRAAKDLGILQRVLLVHHQAVQRLRLAAFVESCVDRRVANWATLVVSVSNATRATLIERRSFDPARVPMHVVLNGTRNSLEADKTALRRTLMLENNKKLIGIVGRVEEYKGHDDLIQAVAKLPADLLDQIKLVIVGSIEATRKREIEILVAKLNMRENVLITGFLNLSSQDIVGGLDLLVSATRDFEGFGLTILEAMVVGTPVIATDVGGVSEFFDDRFGRLISPMDVDELANAICAVFKSPIETRLRVASAKIRSREFTGTRTASELYKLLKPNN